MWRDEKIEYLRKNRDYSRLLEGDETEVQISKRRSKIRKFDAGDGDISPERKEYLDRRRRLKELEHHKLTKGKNGLYPTGSRVESKTGDKHENRVVGRSGAQVSFSKDRKKLPYDRSFGSFFGPSEPVVARRIIEEARAREEAEIVAARKGKARKETQLKKSAASLSAGKTSHSSKLPTPPKPLDKSAEKARKLKEARDYSFLFDESPLPPPGTEGRERPTSSNFGEGRHDLNRVLASNVPLRNCPFSGFKSTLKPRGFDGPSPSRRLFESQSKSSQPFQSLSSQDPRTVVPRESIVGSNTEAKMSMVAAAGPGRPSPKEAHARKAGVMRKVGAESPASIGNKNPSADRRLQSFPGNYQKEDRHAPKQSNRRPVQLSNRLPLRVTERQLAQLTDRHPNQSSGSRPAQVKDGKPVLARASKRGTVTSQVLKKGALKSAKERAVADRGEPRLQVPVSEKLKRKPSLEGASRVAASDHNRARNSEKSWQVETHKKRARSGRLSEDENDDDSFVDDDEDPGNVSSMIQRIMGYNPHRYRGNDDFDDRSMEVGFRTIQAEERRSAREARLEDERELALIEAEERAERLRKAKKKSRQN